MIQAAEALRLPIAQLSPEELEAADKLEAEIDAAVRENMTRSGVNFQSAEKRAGVITEINLRMKAAGWEPSIQIMSDVHPLNKAIQVVVGFRMALPPSEESFRAAARSVLQ